MQLLLFFAVSFAAVCVWLAVRVMNRRERWAKWTLATMLVIALFGYPVSIGPACWLTARPYTPLPRVVFATGRTGGAAGGGGTPRPSDPPNQAMGVYFPLLDFLSRNPYTKSNSHTISIEHAVIWWMRVGMPRGTQVKIPDPKGKGAWLGFAKPNDIPPATWQSSPSWQIGPSIWILFVVCPIGIGLSIWHAPDATICALFGKTSVNQRRWLWRVRVAGTAAFAFGLAFGTLYACLP